MYSRQALHEEQQVGWEQGAQWHTDSPPQLEQPCAGAHKQQSGT